MSNKKFDIVGMADCCVDCTITVEKLPTHNEGSRTESMTFQGGGNVATEIDERVKLYGRSLAYT